MLNKQDGAKRNDEATVNSTSPCKTSFKREIDEPDYDALKDLKACQREYEENDNGYHAKLYELLQRSAYDAELIRKSDGLWEKFATDSFWKKSNKNGKERQQKLKRKPKATLRYALIYMLRAHTEAARQRARKFSRAVFRHLDNGIKTADLAATMSLPGNGIEESSHADKSGTVDGTADKKPDKGRGSGGKAKLGSNNLAMRTLDLDKACVEDLDAEDEDFDGESKATNCVRTWKLSSGKRKFRKMLGRVKVSETIDVRLKCLQSDGWFEFAVVEILTETD